MEKNKCVRGGSSAKILCIIVGGRLFSGHRDTLPSHRSVEDIDLSSVQTPLFPQLSSYSNRRPRGLAASERPALNNCVHQYTCFSSPLSEDGSIGKWGSFLLTLLLVLLQRVLLRWLQSFSGGLSLLAGECHFSSRLACCLSN